MTVVSLSNAPTAYPAAVSKGWEKGFKSLACQPTALDRINPDTNRGAGQASRGTCRVIRAKGGRSIDAQHNEHGHQETNADHALGNISDEGGPHATCQGVDNGNDG